MTVEDTLRSTLNEMVEEVELVHLGQQCLHRAKRRRAAGVGAAVAASASAVAVVGAAVFSGAGGGSSPHQRAETAALPVAPITIENYRVTGWGGSCGTPAIKGIILNADGKYERVPYCQAVPSPEGDRAFVTASFDSHTGYRKGILDPATGRVHWLKIDTATGTGWDFTGWSPDSSTLLFRVDPGGEPAHEGFGIVNATTGVHKILTFAGWRFHDAQLMPDSLSWDPDGRHILVKASGSDGTYLQRFGLDGQGAGTLPISGAVRSVANWSPDGKHVVITDGNTARIVDSHTGHAVGTIQARVRTAMGAFSGAQAWWTDNTHILIAAAGPRDQDQLDLVTMHGDVVQSYQLPDPTGDPDNIAVTLQPQQ